MAHRSGAVQVLAGSLAVLLVGLALIPLPGPGLLVAAAGALGFAVGLAVLVAERVSSSPDGAPGDKR